MHLDDPVRMWVPIEFVEPDVLMKADAEWPAAYEVRGVVSSQAVDLDGEVINQRGINWGPFMMPDPMTGKPLAPLTWGHPNRGINVIGRGKSLHEISLPDGTPATALIGTIMTGHPMGRDACTMHKAATAAGLPGLGFSIEGNATQRDPDNRKHILACTVWSVAVDPSPRNGQSLLDPYMQAIGALAKALVTGSEWDAHGMPAQAVLEAFVKALPGVDLAKARLPAPVDRIQADLMKGLNHDDLRALRILRRNPTMSFHDAMDFLAGLKSRGSGSKGSTP